jgi:hypothetical protein
MQAQRFTAENSEIAEKKPESVDDGGVVVRLHFVGLSEKLPRL